jgi:hypothetical protein
MKIIKLLVSTAMIAASPTAFVAPANATATQVPIADDANATTLAAMQTQCNALAAAHDLLNGDIWSGEVVEGAVTLVVGPTETGGRVIDLNTVVGAGTFTPGATTIVGDPYRNGGSVNMFGNAWATSGHWSASTYDYTADFSSTFAHAFSCDILQAVYHPAVHHPATPVQGHYINCDFGNGQGNDNGNACTEVGEPQGSCAAHNADGSSWPGWGYDTEQCKFIVTEPAHPAYDDPAYNDPAAVVGNEAGTAVNQDQSDNLTGHEANGAGFDIGGNIFVGQVVVCISPSKTVKGGVPGAWQKQNGYTGTKCTTAWFNVAPWGNGSQTSNGTYISVPPV